VNGSTILIAANAHVRFVGHLVKIQLTINCSAKTGYSFVNFQTLQNLETAFALYQMEAKLP